jgi:hypothetical protein
VGRHRSGAPSFTVRRGFAKGRLKDYGTSVKMIDQTYGHLITRADIPAGALRAFRCGAGSASSRSGNVAQN